MPLSIHLAIHFILALLVGYFLGRRYRLLSVGLSAGIAGGFFIDLDHVLEYFLVFGWQFDPARFLMGYQFLASGLIRVWFHAWEYFPILMVLAWIMRSRPVLKAAIITLAWSGAVHLASDSLINNYPVRNYSLLYRYRQDFKAENLLNEEQYSKYQAGRIYYGF